MTRLSGKRILVVEDEFFVVEEIVRLLKAEGAEVLGPAPSQARARALLSGPRPDCALLDLNLRDERAFELAREVMQAGIPVVLSTGYDAGAIPTWLSAAPRLEKPWDGKALIAFVEDAIVNHLQ